MNKNDTKKTKVKSNKEVNSMNNNVSEEKYDDIIALVIPKEYSVSTLQKLCDTISLGLLDKGYCYFHTYVEIDYRDITIYVELYDEYDNHLGVIQFVCEENNADNYVLVPSVRVIKLWNRTNDECAENILNFYKDVRDILCD